jgi:hypothetical protein
LTPHIVQSMTPPGPSKQTFWSGTDSTYATNPLFTPQGKTISGSKLLNSGVTDVRGAGIAKTSGSGKSAIASLARMATVGQIVSIKPETSIVSVGKEFKLAFNDERLRPAADGVFQLRFDAKILQLKSLSHGDVIPTDRSTQDSDTAPEGDGPVEFTISSAAPRAAGGGRVVTATFVAKAPGVSPVTVSLKEAAGDSSPPSFDGRGIVRVR